MAKKTWLVVENDLTGVPHVVASNDRAIAINYFLGVVYLHMHAAPNESFKVVGDDVDAALSGLHLLMQLDDSWVCMAALTQPALIEPQEDYDTLAANAPDFASTAMLIQGAIENNHGKLDQATVEKLSHSLAAMHIYRPLADIIASEEADDCVQPAPEVQRTDIENTWRDMGRVKHMISMTAVVQG